MLPKKVVFLVRVSNFAQIDINTESETHNKKVTFLGNTQETPRPGNPRGVTWMLPSVTWSMVYNVWAGQFVIAQTVWMIMQPNLKTLKPPEKLESLVELANLFILFLFKISVLLISTSVKD